MFVCFEKFCLLYGNSCISPQECDKAFLKIVFEKCVTVKKFKFDKVPNSYLPTRKRMLFSFSFGDSTNHTISW